MTAILTNSVDIIPVPTVAQLLVKVRAEAKMQGWRVSQMWSLPRPDYDYDF